MVSAPDTNLEAALAAVAEAADLKTLEELRVRLLGRKSDIAAGLRGLGALPESERKEAGRRLNRLRDSLEEALGERKRILSEAEFSRRSTQARRLDPTLPGRGRPRGSVHPISLTLERLETLFAGAGFETVEGPEIEDEYHNFTALNIPPNHPARAMHDTFYLPDGLLLRTHTSPAQIHALAEREPPFRIVCPGRVYRRDLDLTHTPMFHQLEGLWIDEGLGLAQLKSLVAGFLRAFFEDETLRVRLRPSYFPFTEPSAEVDIGCALCERGCRVCSGSGWLEIMGCGVVHGKVLEEAGVDSARWSGVAFGMGVERLAMLRHGIGDLRLFFENDAQFLRQFRLR